MKYVELYRVPNYIVVLVKFMHSYLNLPKILKILPLFIHHYVSDIYKCGGVAKEKVSYFQVEQNFNSINWRINKSLFSFTEQGISRSYNHWFTLQPYFKGMNL